jgi:hypothetical protein
MKKLITWQSIRRTSPNSMVHTVSITADTHFNYYLKGLSDEIQGIKIGITRLFP